MGPDAPAGPPSLRVERRAETNRLAKDFQAQAYEELLSGCRRGPTTTAAAVSAAVAGTSTSHQAQKGVAA